MILFKKRFLSFIALIVLIIFNSCNHTTSNNESSSGCVESVSIEYKKIVSAKQTDSIKILKLKSLFNSTAPTCLNSIADSIYTNLFITWLGNLRADPNLISFFRNAYSNQQLPINIRLRALTTQSLILYVQENLKAMDSCLAITKNYEKDFDSYSLMSYCKGMGLLYLGQNKLHDAAQILEKGIERGEKENIKDHLLGDLYTNYGNAYFQTGNYKKAIDTYQKNIKLIQNTTNDITEIQANLSNIGFAFQILQEYDSAICYLQKGILLQSKIGGSEYNFQSFSLYVNLGSSFLFMNKNDSARYYFSKAKPIMDYLNNPNMKILYLMGATVADASIRDVSNEVSEIKDYLPKLYQSNDLLNLNNAYISLMKIATIKKKDSEALQYHTVLDSIKEVMSSTENKQIVSEMEFKYETAKKDLEILQQKQNINFHRILIAILLIIMAIAALSTVVIMQKMQLKQKNKTTVLQQQFTTQLLQQSEQDRERIASDLHDGICNDLTIVRQHIINSEEAIHKLDGILEEIRQIARNLHPQMLSTLGLKICVENLCKQLTGISDITIKDIIYYTEGLSKNKELHLFRIIQEALNNIIKHSGATNATVSITKQGGLLLTEIKDDGYGFNVEAALKSGKAFGMLSIMEHAKAMGGIGTIESGEKGSTVKVVVSGNKIFSSNYQF